MTWTTWKAHTEHGSLSSADWKQLGRTPHTPNDAR